MTSHFISQPSWFALLCQVLIHCLSASNSPFNACSDKKGNSFKHFSFYSKNDVRLSQKTHEGTSRCLCRCRTSRMARSLFRSHVLQASHPLWHSDPLSVPAQWLRLTCALRAASYFPSECGQIWPQQPNGLCQWTATSGPWLIRSIHEIGPWLRWCPHTSLEPPKGKMG